MSEFFLELFSEEIPAEQQKNLRNINCYSNEGDIWDKSKLEIKDNNLFIQFGACLLFPTLLFLDRNKD